MKCNVEIDFFDDSTGYVNVEVPKEERGNGDFICSCNMLVRGIAHSVAAHLTRVDGTDEWVAHTSELNWYDEDKNEIQECDEEDATVATVQCTFYK